MVAENAVVNKDVEKHGVVEGRDRTVSVALLS